MAGCAQRTSPFVRWINTDGGELRLSEKVRPGRKSKRRPQVAPAEVGRKKYRGELSRGIIGIKVNRGGIPVMGWTVSAARLLPVLCGGVCVCGGFSFYRHICAWLRLLHRRGHSPNVPTVNPDTRQCGNTLQPVPRSQSAQ